MRRERKSVDMLGIIDSSRLLVRAVRNKLRHVPYTGTGRFCPVCRRESRKFGVAGIHARHDAKCMYCGAVERHRLTWVYFEKKTDLFDGKEKQMLHVAPEPIFERQLRQHVGDGYLTADLYNPRAMVKMDITDIQYPDESFDVVYCSHVLEHIPDDLRAMRELRRVLKKDGWAILLVPIAAKKTYEDPSITSPSDRLAHFGQSDHVRKYGPDYVDRLIEAGFEVRISAPTDFLTDEEIEIMGIDTSENIYFCTK